jgi:CheY-like chemotaxis protein
MMPEMDGFELAERIRRSHDTDDMKLIVLSSATRSDDASRCALVGVERYMTKPVVQSELLDCVLQVMGVEQHKIAEPVKDVLPECPSMRILVAEDGLANQHVAIGLLKLAGHKATIASDGKEALSRWRQGGFDAILMDVHMPEMDGLEATRAIRREEQKTGGHIPIIALTAAAMEEDARACHESGMDDYLTKPIHPRSLQMMLLKHAPLSATSADSVVDGEAGAAVTDQTKDSEQATHAGGEAAGLLEDIIDVQAAAGRVAGGVEGVLQLSSVFRREATSLMDQMRNAANSDEAGELQRAAHTMKGSANLFVAKRVSSLATEIEQRAKRGELTDIAISIRKLEDEVQLLFEAIERLKSESSSSA